MAFIGRMLSNVASFYKEINSATLTGAIDVLVIEQPDGEYFCSPFHVRFGKMGVMRSREKVVDILINDEPVDIHMKLGEGGEAFFVEKLEESDEEGEAVPAHLTTSPLPSEVDQVFEAGFVEKLRESSGQVEIVSGDPEKSRSSSRDSEETSLEKNGGGVYRCSSEGQNLSKLFTKKKEKFKSDDEDSGEKREQQQDVVGEKKKMRRKKKELDEGRNRWNKKENGQPPTDGKAEEGTTLPFRRAKSWSGSLENLGRISTGAAVRRKKFVTGSKKSNRQISSPMQATAGSLSLSLYQSTEDGTFSTAPTELTDYDNGSSSRKKSLASYYSTTAGSEEDERDQPVQFVLDDISSDEERSSSSNVPAPTSTSDPFDRPSCLLMDELDRLEKGFRFDDDMENLTTEDDEKTPTANGFYAVAISKLSSSLPVRLTHDANDTKLKLTALNPYFHPFSDTDITPCGSREGSRPPTPTKSDTELNRLFKDEMSEGEPEWKWGQLPDTTPTEESPPISGASSSQAESGGWGLSSMLGLGHFMRRTKKVRYHPEAEGIYLEDLVKSNEMDPKVAALYFPKSRFKKEEKSDSSTETETTCAASTASSATTSSVTDEISTRCLTSDDPGYSSKPSSVSGEETEQEQDQKYKYDLGEVTLSLCGGLDAEGNVSEDAFRESVVGYEQLNRDPNLLFNENLVVKVDGKYYNWKAAAPMLVSFLAFQKTLSENTVSSLRKPSGSSSGGVTSWFYWRRATSADPPVNKKAEDSEKRATTPIPTISSDAQVATSGAVPVPSTKDSVKSDDDSLPGSPSSALSSDSGGPASTTTMGRCKKSLRMTSDQLKSLNLQPGSNEARFSVTTKYQGTTYCICHIYLWQWYDRIVISDIDGTITKSDVLGQILPAIGGQWAQAGVADLFTRICSNGYKIVYLSARAIGQSSWTKDYLRSVKQDEHQLPQGPLLLSPTSLISAFHREVIEKKPEEFKKSCLNDIKALFPETVKNPFYAGFGNRINDVWAYQAVGIPISRIYTINHLGEVRYELTKGFSSTYKKMSSDLLDHMFPPLSRKSKPVKDVPNLDQQELGTSFTSPEEFSAFTFWNPTADQVDVDLDKFPSPDSRKSPTVSVDSPRGSPRKKSEKEEQRTLADSPKENSRSSPGLNGMK